MHADCPEQGEEGPGRKRVQGPLELPRWGAGGHTYSQQGWRRSARDIARKTLARRQETGRDILQPEVDTGPRCLSLRRTAAYY